MPDELTIFGGLLHAPDGARIAALIVCDCGSSEAALQSIKKFGRPIMDTIGSTSYEATNMMLDAGFPRGALNYWKSNFMAELSDQSIDTLVSQFTLCPSPLSALVLEHIHGAATRVAVDETAFPHRHEGYNCLIVSQWLTAAENTPNIGWARETYELLRPGFAAGRYVNYLGDDDSGQDAVAAAYGPNYQRLQTLKAKYDPANLFHLNQNIRP